MYRRTLLRCMPAAPIAIATPAAAALPVFATREADASDDDREVIAVCESCEKDLFEGDLVFAYSDGPTFCETHSPTWNDLKAEQDELIADGTFVDAFEEPDDAEWARASVLSHIEAGKGDVKYVWAL